MVGLVLVSHSRLLAEALLQMLQQVASPAAKVAIAAGVGPERRELGTDAVEISEAITSVYSPDGVVVLMDLGSAILSSEMALELLPEEMQRDIRFCAAPFVEGAIAAAVQASLGSDLQTVCREAQNALQPKLEQLEQEGEASGTTASIQQEAITGVADQASLEKVLTLKNAHGLHARPAARFVQLNGKFDADVQVRNLTKGKGPAAANSLNALATLAAVHGDQIAISARGLQAQEALEALSGLVEANFGEEIEAPSPQAPTPQAGAQQAPREEGALAAVAVSDGSAVGPLFIHRPQPRAVPEDQVTDPQTAWKDLEKALQAVRGAIQEQRRRTAALLGEDKAAIFDAHLLILEDPELLKRVHSLVFDQHFNPALAWQTAITETAQSYLALEDPYLRQRVVDVQDVGAQVVNALLGEDPHQKIQIPTPSILFAAELTPAETAHLELDKVLGLISTSGGPTSHSAILARAMGIPAVTGADPTVGRLLPGILVGLDGSKGLVWIEPPGEIVERLKKARQDWQNERLRLLQASRQPAVTRDGKRRVEVAANVSSLQDAEAAEKNGAEAIGLLRTEFLFLDREIPPGEEEQVITLNRIGEVMGARPVIVRTLDVGGDKALKYIDLPNEDNPFLGVRAIRLSLHQPDLFTTQLRAILRAGANFNLRIMFPMVTVLDEYIQARQMLENAHLALELEGLAHRWPVETGIMAETPAAALLSDEFAKHVSFLSIGTNDLTQYTLAAERGNASLAAFSDALHPAVLRLIQQVVRAAHERGLWAGVCGELAGDPTAVPVLIGLGVDELSASPDRIPRIKAIIRAIDFPEAQNLALRLLAFPDAPAARRLAQAFLEETEIEQLSSA